MEKKATYFVMGKLAIKIEGHRDIVDFLNYKFKDSKGWIENSKELIKEYNEKYFNFSDFVNNDTLEIDYDFAKSLNLFDAVAADCFTSKTVAGSQLIDFMTEHMISFYVFMKTYKNKNHIEITFKMSDEYYGIETMEYFTKK